MTRISQSVASLLSVTLLCANFVTGEDEGARLQGIAVRGRFFCGSRPADHITVKIIDRDRARGDPDDLLDETLTDADGRFTLSGVTREIGDIEAAIKVYHDCNDEHRACQRKMIWDIPKSYNNDGEVTQWFDIGEINLELIFGDEERDCRHRRHLGTRARRHHRRTRFINADELF